MKLSAKPNYAYKKVSQQLTKLWTKWLIVWANERRDTVDLKINQLTVNKSIKIENSTKLPSIENSHYKDNI